MSAAVPNTPATVRISGPPNSSFLVGYPGISATLVSRHFLGTPMSRIGVACRGKRVC